ncbi:MAG: Lar family restriction alleviation protein [Roseburia sp.]|nr:Lar family restriction alleviation protein [Roseburia sp.]
MDKKENYIFVGAIKGSEAYHYRFACPHCDNACVLATGRGRFGHLGYFMCTDCGQLYYATIDEHRFPKLYVAEKDSVEQPFAILKEMDDKC